MPNVNIAPHQVAFDRPYTLSKNQGIGTETFDRRGAITSTAPTASGQVRIISVPVIQGDEFSNLAVYCYNSAGVGVSLCKIGMWDVNGNLVAGTADLSASLATTTWISGAITPVTFSYTGVAYLGLLSVYATTAPQFGAASQPSTWASLPTGSIMGWTKSGAADLASYTPINTLTANTIPFYIVAY